MGGLNIIQKINNHFDDKKIIEKKYYLPMKKKEKVHGRNDDFIRGIE